MSTMKIASNELADLITLLVTVVNMLDVVVVGQKVVR